MPMDLREQKFGIEIELTGLTRKRAAEKSRSGFPKQKWRHWSFS